MDDAEFRESVLRAFDVTEDELKSLDPDGSYEAARAQARREQQLYWKWVQKKAAEFGFEL